MTTLSIFQSRDPDVWALSLLPCVEKTVLSPRVNTQIAKINSPKFINKAKISAQGTDKLSTLSDITDFPILSFDQDLSECLNVGAMDTTANMEPFNFYDIEVAKSTLKNTGELSGELTPLVGTDFLDLPDLDPSLEEPAVDLQQLINRVNQETEPSQAPSVSPALAAQLFPDLLGPVPDSPAPEGPNSNTTTGTSDTNPMPVLEVQLNQNSQTASNFLPINNILTIRPNDLDLSSITNIQIVSSGQGLEGSAATPVNVVTEASTGVLTPAPSPAPSTSRNTLKATPPSKSSGGRRKVYDKGSEEYKDRRERNNIAVRKSRDKSKKLQQETQGKVQELSEENERLQKKVDLLTKELTVLKGLFSNVGAILPPQLKDFLK